MNIVHLFCYPGDGGAEKYALYLADESKKSGHEVSFVLGEDGLLAEGLKIRNLKFEIISMPSWFSLKSAFSLKKYFTEKNIEIVHTHFLREHFLSVLAKILGADVKIIRTFHRLDQLPLKVRIFYKIVQHKTNGFIAVSEYLKNQMVKFGIKNEKIETIYNGVPEVKVNSHAKAIGYLGRLTEEKGIYDFANKYTGETELIIAGDGPDRSKIEKINNKNIIMLGNVNNLSSFFEKISVLVLPSKTEVMPLSVLESYSAGVPVISFDIEPLREIIPKNNRAKVGDYTEMINLATKSLISNEENYQKLYEDKYTVNMMWEKTESLYKKVLG